MFCRLEEFVNTVIIEAGGKKIRDSEFKYRGDNLSLHLEGDLKPLVQPRKVVGCMARP